MLSFRSFYSNPVSTVSFSSFFPWAHIQNAIVIVFKSPKIDKKSQGKWKRVSVNSALPETAASVAIAATIVGAAATLLVQRNKASKETEVPMKTCEDCGGSGICPECKGEGFVLKKLSDESADRARLNSKNMATRYTAALPKKWSYCTKCSSSRSCMICSGRGKIII
ncbi:hypothetical protein UlMin_028925 [Ulmus minor]